MNPLRVIRLVLALLLAGSGAAFVVPVAQAAPLGSSSVQVRVVNLDPLTPPATATATTLTITVQLVNNTDQTLRDVELRADRGNPINNQAKLDDAIARPTEPDPGLDSPIQPDREVTTTLGAHAAVTVQFVTKTSTVNGDGLCLCADAIYPLYLTAHYIGGGSDVVVGVGQTYLPAFGTDPPNRVHVAWVWPLIDRPHRVSSDTVFLDDDLATSVSTGRLDRALTVIEDLGPDATLTLVLDPELLDELAVMGTGQYQVQPNPSTPAQPGSGAAAAAARDWLTRLSTLLSADRRLDVRYTGPADPDFNTLAQHGLGWSNALSAAAASRVSRALGGFTPDGTIAWPAGAGVDPDALTAAVRRGAGTVLLPGTALTTPPTAGAAGSVDLASISGLSEPAAVARAQVTTAAQRALALTSTAVGALPQLVAQTALPAAVAPGGSSYVVIAAPRYVDPGPAAGRAITDTTKPFWSIPTTLTAAADAFRATAGRLATPETAAIPTSTVDAALRARSVSAVVQSLATPAGAQGIVSTLGPASQRITSSAWIVYPSDAAPALTTYSATLDSLSGAVHLVQPKTGTYTLASSNSPLPLTVQNDLDVAVQVRIRVSAVDGLPSLSATDIGVRSIAPHTTLTLHVPLHFERSGRFRVAAQLLTPSRQAVGEPLQLSVHSTALGVLGVAITVGAGAILLIALLIRLIRRLRTGRPPPLAPPTVDA